MNDEVEVVESSDELDALKARADLMGIKYHPNTGIDKLRAKINNALSGGEESKTITSLSKGTSEYISEEEFKKQEKSIRAREAGKLVRVRVTCMNPNKKDWEGEIISVGSAKLGTFKKFVPFNADEGWHVPKIIYDYMKDRKCSVFQTVKDSRGQKIRKAKMVNEFSIEVLPPLTKEEIKDLAQKQAMAGSVDNG